MRTIFFHRFFTDRFFRVMCDPIYKPAPILATIKQISVQKYQGSALSQRYANVFSVGRKFGVDAEIR